MKILKISLALILLFTITFFIINSLIDIDKVGTIKEIETSVSKIEQEIKVLQGKPENKFCKEDYVTVNYHIDDYHKRGMLGKSKEENEQWKIMLSKDLYVAYTEKFVKQAFYVFNNPEWPINDLVFIRDECNILQNSPMLQRNSIIDLKFNEIEGILNKYDEITEFISTCKNFSYTQTDLDSSFPIGYVENKIYLAKKYSDSQLENSNVNNCARLHNELGEIPLILFNSHVKYLDSMINFWSNEFKGYTTQKAYLIGLYNPLKNKINQLDNDIYQVSEFSIEYKRLINKWEADGANAYNHKY